MQASPDDLVIGGIDVVRDIQKVRGEAGEAIRLADGVGVVIAAQGKRQLEVRSNAPLVLPIESQTVYCYGFSRALRKVFNITDAVTVVEAQQVVALAVSDCSDAGGIICDVIAVEVDSELECVLADCFRIVVDDAILSHIATLRPNVEISPQRIKRIPAKAEPEGN